MSLGLWEYFWNQSDWGAVAAATTVTFTGPTTGLTGQVSSNFTVGANGSISGTLVVTITNTGGTGSFVPTNVFSLSSGSTTRTFTYTPTTLGAHLLTDTNNQSLVNAPNISYLVLAATPVLASTTVFGAARREQQYEPLPDDYWQNRERHLREDFRLKHPEAFTHLSVLEPNMEVHNAIAELQSERAVLSDALPQASDVQQLKAMAQRIQGIDAEIADMAPSRYTLVKKNIT